MGMDAGLRDGNMDVAIVGDFEDEDAYRAYDADPEHNRIRRELLAPIAERVERCQYRIWTRGQRRGPTGGPPTPRAGRSRRPASSTRPGPCGRDGTARPAQAARPAAAASPDRGWWRSLVAPRGRRPATRPGDAGRR